MKILLNRSSKLKNLLFCRFFYYIYIDIPRMRKKSKNILKWDTWNLEKKKIHGNVIEQLIMA